MRVVSWNFGRATASSVAWDMLMDMDPDIALLEEVSEFSASITSRFDARFETAIGKTGNPQKSGTAVLVKESINGLVQLLSEFNWINDELRFFGGNLVGSACVLNGQSCFDVVSVYSPAWPADKERLASVDVSTVILENNPDIWCTEVLWLGLKGVVPDSKRQWIVGGDFNSSEAFDYLWKSGPRGNKQVLDRMSEIGFEECLRSFNGELTPTFRNPRGGKIIHQLDHIFVTDKLQSSLESCVVGDSSKVFGEHINDHLPVIGDCRDI